MVNFSCPRCGQTFESPHAGVKFNCNCGQRLQVPDPPLPPPNKTVLGKLADEETELLTGNPAGQSGRPVFLPPTESDLDQSPAFSPAPTPVVLREPITVRCMSNPGFSSKFKTHCRLRKVIEAMEDMMDRLGLFVEDSGDISGQLRHSHTLACTVTVRGEARQRKENEFIIDVSLSKSMPVAAILICIFLFPLGLILMLVFYSVAQTEADRLIEGAFRDLKSRLVEK